MSSRTREYVTPNGPMFRAVGYNAEGVAVAAAGPYATRRPAAAMRASMWRRGVVRVRVEICEPVWAVVSGTEIERP